MVKFKEFAEKGEKKVDCENIKEIQDINKQYDYEDKIPGDKRNQYIACGQDGSYNELKNIYEKWLEPEIDKKKFTKEKAIKALCETCAEMDSPRPSRKFKDRLGKKLNINIP